MQKGFLRIRWLIRLNKNNLLDSENMLPLCSLQRHNKFIISYLRDRKMKSKASLASRLQCVLLMLVVARTAAAGSIIYVDADAAGANNGSSWENAYVFLQDALADAETAEKPVEIRIAQGTYKPDQGENQTLGDIWATFQLINGVTIEGGYAGFDELNPNTRDIKVYETILSGDLNGDDIDINDPCDLGGAPNRYDNSKVVVTGSNTDETTILDGFIISSGHWDETIGCMIRPRPIRIVNGGAGMNNSTGSPTVISCTFTLNTTNWHGAGMHNAEGSNPTVIDCIFTMNYASSGGAAMANRSDCNPNVINCDFSDNFVRYDGGAMVNFNSSPTLTDCTFSRNSSFRPLYGYDAEGGGMRNINSNPILTGCIFSENSSAIGGAIYNRDSNTTLYNCEFLMNTASSYDGAILNNGGQLVAKNCIFRKNYPGAVSDGNSNGTTFTNCIFSGNSSPYNGGAVSVETASFSHCLFTGNRSLGKWNTGGAVFSLSIVSFNNCTFSNNWADSKCAISFNGVAYVNNCIFWEHEDQISAEIYYDLIFVDYSDIQGGWTWPGKGNIDADPCFVDPGYWANADDPNIIAEPNDPNAFWIDGDYHLISQAGRWDPISESWVFDEVTSLCIDAGAPNMPVGAEPEPNGGIVNMGAYGGTPQASMSPSGLHAIYGGGTGTPSHPYLIYTAEQLNTIGVEPNDWDKHFKLMADIDLSAYSGTDFNIIGQSYENPFNGLIDGNGHTISNFTFADSHGLGIGLIGYLGTSGCVKNLILTDADVEGHVSVGSLVGHSRGIVQNCRIEKGRIQGFDCTGGIVGHSNNPGLIIECHADVNVSGNYYTGGIAGANSEISSCSVTGSVEGRYYTGGITGGQSGNSVIHDCYSACFISGSHKAIGGLIGLNYSGSVSRCHSTGAVAGTGRADGVGGLVGTNPVLLSSDVKGTINQCHSSSDVSGFSNIGGLVGINCGTISDCYTTGSVNGVYTVGGLVGRNSYYYGQEVFPGYIYNCYSTGSIFGDVHGGGLTGYSYEGEIGDCFWDIETSSWLTSDGGTGKFTVEMQTSGTFLHAGWDFVDETENGTEDIWWILEGQDYPRLWWETTENDLIDN